MPTSLSLRMLLGLALGAVLGVAAHLALAESPLLAPLVLATDLVGRVFLRLLLMLVLPVVVAALALGVAGLGDLTRLGRVGLKTLLYTVAVSAVAVLIGVGMVTLFRPGDDASPELRAELARRAGTAPAPAAAGATGADFFVNLVPSNVVKAMAEGDLLAVMCFALFLGVGLLLTPTPAAASLAAALQGLYDVVMRLLQAVIAIAPYAVACLVFTLTARLGYELLGQLLGYVAVVVAALALHQFVVYPVLLRWLGGMSPLSFFRAARPALITAFSTASSNATLPTALLVAEERLRLPRHVARFVLTVGSTANQNGTALFEGVTVLFLAQLYGVELGLLQSLTVVAICILGGIGTAGVPAGSLPVVAMILGTIGVPPEAIGLILGVDRLLDMCRTTLNVTGDLVAAVVVSRGEPAGELGQRPAES